MNSISKFLKVLDEELRARILLFSFNFKIVETIFKYFNFIFTVVAFTYAASITHSRFLYIASYVLSTIMIIPIMSICYPNGLNFRNTTTLSKVILFLCFILTCLTGGIIHSKIRLIVDSIIEYQYIHK